ncbi:FAD-dependent oxidoreductase [bacterium]|nr:FAD-dependent oxidoreductase [bacterium]
MITRRAFLEFAGMLGAADLMAKNKHGPRQQAAQQRADSIEEPPRKTPVVQEVDVCIVGGGCTGVFAAVRAAQMGAGVVLIEKQNAFGGVAGSGLVNVWHKLESNQEKKPIIAGLTLLVLERLMKIDAARVHGKQGYILNTDELKIELDRLIVENRVTPMLHTYYTGAHLQDQRVSAVFVENKNGRQAIRAKVFVDASGDGDLARDAGLAFTIRDGLQPPTTCAEISGLPARIHELIRAHREEFGLALDHGWGAPVPGSPGVEMCAYTHAFNTIACNADQLTAAEIEGRRQIRAYMDLARKYGGTDNKPCLVDMASTIGVRETRSFKANYTLTETDVVRCRRFPDAIANGTYHIDVHDPETGEFKFKEPEGDFYQIPLSTMVSDRAANLIMAGRMISADRSAFGGIRVMVNLNQVGEAAGVTAALAAANSTPISQVDAVVVRRRLADLGAIML